MRKMILISLIHNRRALVGHAVQSAINQTLNKSEWLHLLVDNKSTDGADKIAEIFDKKYEHIKLIKMDENLGQQKAFNYVLNEWLPKNMPEAEIWINLDSDDELMSNALAEVKKMFDAHSEIGQVYSGFDIIDGKSNVKHRNHAKAKMVPNQFSEQGQKQLRRIFLSQNPIGHIRAFRVKALVDIGGFNTNYEFSTDYNIAGRMLQKYPVAKIDKVLYRWRQHKQQVERQHSPQQTKDWKDMQAEFKKIFAEKNLI